jgi:hypothetical protein
LLLTVVAAAGVAHVAGWDFALTLIILLVLSVFFHWLFCVPTAVTRFLTG